MIIINNYQLEEIEDKVFYVRSNETNNCPVCEKLVYVQGVRRRKYITDSGDYHTLIIRRLRCRGCNKIHHELPDKVIPYKRHCSDTIENIIAGEVSGLPCEESTVRRINNWWAACLLYFENVLVSLRAKYGVVFSLRPAPKEIVRAVVNASLWVHTRSAFLSG